MKKIPMGEIGSILIEGMDWAVKNGANSISMPDEYVKVAHFLAYPEEYGIAEWPSPEEIVQATLEVAIQVIWADGGINAAQARSIIREIKRYTAQAILDSIPKKGT